MKHSQIARSLLRCSEGSNSVFVEFQPAQGEHVAGVTLGSVLGLESINIPCNHIDNILVNSNSLYRRDEQQIRMQHSLRNHDGLFNLLS